MTYEDRTRSKYERPNRAGGIARAGRNSLEEIKRRQETEKSTDVEEVTREDLMPGAKRKTGKKRKLDPETLEMIKRVKEAQDAVSRRTARLVGHLVEVPDFTTRIPPERRLEPSQPVRYPWTKKRGRQNGTRKS
jgi:hypothetical protein